MSTFIRGVRILVSATFSVFGRAHIAKLYPPPRGLSSMDSGISTRYSTLGNIVLAFATKFDVDVLDDQGLLRSAGMGFRRS